MSTEHQDHEGHRIELAGRDGTPELRIDGQPLRHGRLPDGLFFLYDYAYDPSDDLMDLGRRFVRYRNRAASLRREPSEGGR